MENPFVSVVMPVRNCEEYVSDAIKSILSQTYENFEFLIVDDASTDATVETVKSFKDPRIQLIRNEKQKGVAGSLNVALSRAQGKYFARQDGDDLSVRERLRKQVEYLEKHPSCGVVGSCAEALIERESVSWNLQRPLSNQEIRCLLYLENPFIHTSVVIRKSLMDQMGGYCEKEDRQPEDYELWLRLADHCTFANLPECLVTYRIRSGSVSRLSTNPFPYAQSLSVDFFNRGFGRLVPSSFSHMFCGLYRKSIPMTGHFLQVWSLHICRWVVRLNEGATSGEFFSVVEKMQNELEAKQKLKQKSFSGN